jgi:hypothetical protein
MTIGAQADTTALKLSDARSDKNGMHWQDDT